MENEILDYVMETPGNTNPAILKQMLAKNSGGGASMTIVECVTDPETGAMTLDITAKDLYDLFKTGETIMIRNISEEGFEMYARLATAMYTVNMGYSFVVASKANMLPFDAASDNDYPVIGGK